MLLLFPSTHAGHNLLPARLKEGLFTLRTRKFQHFDVNAFTTTNNRPNKYRWDSRPCTVRQRWLCLHYRCLP
jgi:hypothetical protein